MKRKIHTLQGNLGIASGNEYRLHLFAPCEPFEFLERPYRKQLQLNLNQIMYLNYYQA